MQRLRLTSTTTGKKARISGSGSLRILGEVWYTVVKASPAGNVINLRPVHLFYAKKRQNKCSW